MLRVFWGESGTPGALGEEAALHIGSQHLLLSTGVETRFTNGLEPDPRSRPVFASHLPETLEA